jgi:hypothetical protein
MTSAEESGRRRVTATLTEGQERHLRVCLGGLLAEADDLLRWAREGEVATEPWVRRAAVELERLAGAVRETSDVLGLPLQQEEVDPRHRVSAWASIWWGSVLDCRPSALKAYGKVNPQTGRSLEPRVEEIARLLLRIEALSRSEEAEEP